MVILEKIYSYVKPLIVLLLSILLHSLFSLSALFSVLPEASWYSIDVAIYTLVISIFLKSLENCINNKCLRVQIFFFRTGNSTFQDSCNVKVDTENPERLSIQLMVSGNVSNKNNTCIFIEFPRLVAVQADGELTIGELDGNKYYLNLKDVKQGSTSNLNTNLNFLLIENSKPNGDSGGDFVFRSENVGLLTRIINKNKLHINY